MCAVIDDDDVVDGEPDELIDRPMTMLGGVVIGARLCAIPADQSQSIEKLVRSLVNTCYIYQKKKKEKKVDC